MIKFCLLFIQLLICSFLFSISDFQYYLLTGIYHTERILFSNPYLKEVEKEWGPSLDFGGNTTVRIFIDKKNHGKIKDANTYDLHFLEHKGNEYFFSMTYLDYPTAENLIIVVEDDKIWFKDTGSAGAYIYPLGPDNPYFKLSGPEPPETGPYYTPTAQNLRLRVEPELTSSILEVMSPGRMMEIIEYGAEEMINEMDGRWVKIRTVDFIEGWCFDFFLEELDYDFHHFNGLIYDEE